MATNVEMPRLPDNSNRLTIIGTTGTGKTQAALWHLSRRNIDRFPWVVFDFKMDDHINKIERAEHVDVGFVPGKKASGVFVCHPLPNQEEQVQDMIWKLWARQNVGIYVDEGLMVAKNDAMDAVLTQGRSMRIPVIMLTQRPVWLSRFVFSESSFFQFFPLTDERDEDTCIRLSRAAMDFTSLPEYCSYYYDVGRRRLNLFRPVPPEEEILAAINEKLSPRRRII